MNGCRRFDGAAGLHTIQRRVAGAFFNPCAFASQTDELAAVMAFLASDDARLVTGVNMPVDAGLSASNGQPPM